MKSSTLKKIVVKCGDYWMDEHEIDSNLFDDVYVEAATRAIEQRKNQPGLKVTVIIETWEKKDFKRPDKHYCYNTYRIFVNAGIHDKAENLRQNFIKLHGIDLSKESLKGENGDSIKQSDSGSIGR